MIISGSRMIINHQALAMFQMKQMWEHYGNMVIMLISYVEMQINYRNYPLLKMRQICLINQVLGSSKLYYLETVVALHAEHLFSWYALSIFLFFLLSVYINPMHLKTQISILFITNI